MNDPAFARPGTPGMSLRDYFASAAIQGLLSQPQINPPKTPEEKSLFVGIAFAIADEMLKQRKQNENTNQ